MRIPFMIAVAAGLLAAGGAQAASKTPQERLARAIEGRVAGKPVDCINLRDIQSSEIIDRKAILYRVGRTLYVNTPDSGANFLNNGDILVTDTHSSQLCSIDIVRLVDSSSRMPSGSVGLGKFVPYTKPAS
ncbi:hypothetical protein LWE61_05050 [Sphingobium sufflavum]|uniref:hypothetical protein n=1 Tax=Sphingobium sufflavum TaxID=1129547 RepID=UPI001F32F819|nr:hypothetical protein [Sphingobium sufflavum]MCE7795927.1 hypothetical protein [Sphingobium sufflavum]